MFSLLSYLFNVNFIRTDVTDIHIVYDQSTISVEFTSLTTTQRFLAVIITTQHPIYDDLGSLLLPSCRDRTYYLRYISEIVLTKSLIPVNGKFHAYLTVEPDINGRHDFFDNCSSAHPCASGKPSIDDFISEMQSLEIGSQSIFGILELTTLFELFFNSSQYAVVVPKIELDDDCQCIDEIRDLKLPSVQCIDGSCSWVNAIPTYYYDQNCDEEEEPGEPDEDYDDDDQDEIADYHIGYAIFTFALVNVQPCIFPEFSPPDPPTGTFKALFEGIIGRQSDSASELCRKSAMYASRFRMDYQCLIDDVGKEFRNHCYQNFSRVSGDRAIDKFNINQSLLLKYGERPNDPALLNSPWLQTIVDQATNNDATTLGFYSRTGEPGCTTAWGVEFAQFTRLRGIMNVLSIRNDEVVQRSYTSIFCTNPPTGPLCNDDEGCTLTISPKLTITADLCSPGVTKPKIKPNLKIKRKRRLFDN